MCEGFGEFIVISINNVFEILFIFYIVEAINVKFK